MIYKMTILLILLNISVVPRIFCQHPEIDYDDPDCNSKELCLNEKKAISDYFTGRYTSILNDFENELDLEKIEEAKIEEWTNQITQTSSKPKKTELNALIKSSIDITIKPKLEYIKYLYDLNTKLMIELPKSNCIFTHKYKSILYNLCGISKLSKKLLLMAKKRKNSKYEEYAKDILANFRSIYKTSKLKLDEIKNNNFLKYDPTYTPYLSTVATSGQLMDLLKAPYRSFAESVHRLSNTIENKQNIIDNLIKGGKDNKQLEIELNSLKTVQKEIENKIIILTEHSSNLEKENSGIKKEKEISDKYIANLFNDLSPGEYEIKAVGHQKLVINRAHLLYTNWNDNKNWFTLPIEVKNIKYISFQVANDPLIKTNGILLGNYPTDKFRDQIRGKYTDLNGYTGILNDIGVVAAPTQIGSLLLRIRYNKADPSRIWGLRNIGTASIIHLKSTPENFSFMLNDNLVQMDQNSSICQRGPNQKCFHLPNEIVMNVTYWHSSENEFDDAMKIIGDIETRNNILGSIAYSANPLQEGILRMDLLLKKGGINNPQDYHKFSTAFISNYLLFQKGLRITHSKLIADKELINAINKKENLENTVKKLDDIIKNQKNSENLDKIAKYYVQKKLDFEYKILFHNLSNFKKWMEVYSKGIAYKTPGYNRASKKISAINKMIERFLKIKTNSKLYSSKITAEIISNEYCNIFKDAGIEIVNLCKDMDSSTDSKEIERALATFFEEEDRELKKDRYLHQENILHCSLDFNDPFFGKKYLTEFLDIPSVSQIFRKGDDVDDDVDDDDKNKKIDLNTKFFVSSEDTSTKKFNVSDACGLLPISHQKICLSSAHKEKDKNLAYKLLKGYYEIPIQSLINKSNKDKIEYTTCQSLDSLASMPLVIGVAAEWNMKKDFDKMINPRVEISAEKSNDTWWNDYDSKPMTIYQTKVSTSNIMKVNSNKWKENNLLSRSISLVRWDFLHGKKKNTSDDYCINYESIDCVKRILSDSVLKKNEDSILFNTNFYGSRMGNNWTIRIPIYRNLQSELEKELKIKNYKSYRYMAENINRLKFHFYLKVKKVK